MLGDFSMTLKNLSFKSSVELNETREDSQRKTQTDLERRDTKGFERNRKWMDRCQSYIETVREWKHFVSPLHLPVEEFRLIEVNMALYNGQNHLQLNITTVFRTQGHSVNTIQSSVTIHIKCTVVFLNPRQRWASKCNGVSTNCLYQPLLLKTTVSLQIMTWQGAAECVFSSNKSSVFCRLLQAMPCSEVCIRSVKTVTNLSLSLGNSKFKRCSSIVETTFVLHTQAR